MPAKAGIQELSDFAKLNFLHTGLRRCDESFFNSLVSEKRQAAIDQVKKV
jgi:hypothetical protein